MSDQKSRQPRAFSLDNLEDEAAGKEKRKSTGKKAAPKKTAVRRKPKVVEQPSTLVLQPDELAQRIDDDHQVLDELTPPPPPVQKKRFRWARLFWLALGGLVSLAVGLWVDQLIRDLFSRQDWLGWLAVGLAGLLGLAALVLVVREFASLRGMAKIDGLRQRAADAAGTDDMAAAKSIARELDRLYQNRPDTARGRAALAGHEGEIIDGADLLALAERDLLKPLDARARSMVMGSAKRVSVVTAVSPRALVDVGFVLFENMRLIRRLAELYGGRPGTFGFWRLARNVVGHLAATGSIAVGEGLLQQVVGQGLASRISARLGEGVINGLLTTRIGIAAIDVCRPMPFSDQTRPTVRDFLGELTAFSGEGEKVKD